MAGGRREDGRRGEKGKKMGEGEGGGEREGMGCSRCGNYREREKKERDIEGAIKGLARNMALGKYPGIHKDDPSLTTRSNSGEDA